MKVVRELLDEEAFLKSFDVGQPLWGMGIGTVVRSDDPDQAPGLPVLGYFPWQVYACRAAGSLPPISMARAVSARGTRLPRPRTAGPTPWAGSSSPAISGRPALPA